MRTLLYLLFATTAKAALTVTLIAATINSASANFNLNGSCAAGSTISVYINAPSSVTTITVTSTGDTFTNGSFAATQGSTRSVWSQANNIVALSSGNVNVAFSPNAFFGQSAAAFCEAGSAASPDDPSADQTTGGASGTTWTSAAFTTSNANEAVLVGFGASTGGNILTGPGGAWTVGYNNGGAASPIIVLYQIFSSTQGSTTVAATSAGSAAWTEISIGIKQASAGVTAGCSMSLLGVCPH